MSNSQDRYLLAYYNSHPSRILKGVEQVRQLFSECLHPSVKDISKINAHTWVLLGDFDLLTVERFQNYEFPLRVIRDFSFVRGDGRYAEVLRQGTPAYGEHDDDHVDKVVFKAINSIAIRLDEPQAEGDPKDLPILGKVRCVLNKIPGESHYGNIKELVELARSHGFCIEVYKSFSWEDVNILVHSDSIPKIFECLTLISEHQVENINVIANTNTTIGFQYSLLESYIKGDSENLAQKLDVLNDNAVEQSVELAITTSYKNLAEHNRLVQLFDQPDFKKLFRVNYRPGLKDFLIRTNGYHRASTLGVVKYLLAFLDLVAGFENMPNVSFESIIIDKSSELRSLKQKSNTSKLGISLTQIRDLHAALRDHQKYIPTPLRDNLIDLIRKYNTLVASRRIYYSMIDLYEPIKHFVDRVLGRRDGFDIADSALFAQYVSTFVTGLKASINNRLDTSIIYGYHNDYASEYNISKHGFISAVDGYLKSLGTYFSNGPLFCYVDATQGILTSPHHIKIDAYHLFKPEKLAYFFIFELGTKYIEDRRITHFSEDQNALLNLAGSTSARDIVMYYASKSAKGANSKKRIASKKADFYDAIVFDSYFHHLFCDYLSLELLFGGVWEDFYFWHWYVYLCDHNSKDSRQANQHRLMRRYKRYYSRYHILKQFVMGSASQDTVPDNQGVIYDAVKNSVTLGNLDTMTKALQKEMETYLMKTEVVKLFYKQTKSEIAKIKAKLADPTAVGDTDQNTSIDGLLNGNCVVFDNQDVMDTIMSLRAYLREVKKLLEHTDQYGEEIQTPDGQSKKPERWKLSQSGGLIVYPIDQEATKLQTDIFRLRSSFYEKGLELSDIYRTKVFEQNTPRVS